MVSFFSWVHIASVHLRAVVFYCAMAVTALVFLMLMQISIKKNHAIVEIVWSAIPLIMMFVLLIPVVSLFLS